MAYRVCKAIIRVDGDAASQYLMALKRAPGSDNDGKLEFLGGRMESGEAPYETLVRELSEEEATGSLARIVKSHEISPVEHLIGDALHYLFTFDIRPEQYAVMKHHPAESYGLRLVAKVALTPSAEEYTRKTNKIIGLLSL
jgi:8-oxo-dGTP pyrophosphatase MutT (NUDIX family)